MGGFAYLIGLAQAIVTTPNLDPAPPPLPPPPVVMLAKDTLLNLQIDRALASELSKPGDRFPISLTEPLLRDGNIILPAGLTGVGEVIHAAKARWGGKAGELIINARFLTCGAQRVPLGKLRFFAPGESRVGQAFAASMVLTPAMFFISGGNAALPLGAKVQARVTADVALPPQGCVPNNLDGGVSR